MFSQAEFWVGVSTVLFVLALIYLKVPAMVAKALDARAKAIEDELDEAQRLREEAQALLAEHQQKQNEAEKEAEAIVAQAKLEAEAYARESREKLKDQLARRARQAEERIAQAEASALKQVRAAASDLAVETAGEILMAETKGAKASSLIDDSIKLVKSRLN